MARSPKKESDDRPADQSSDSASAQPAEQTKRRSRKKRIDGAVTRPHLTLGESVWERVLYTAAKRKLPPRVVINSTLEMHLPHFVVTQVDRPVTDPVGK